MLKEIHEQPRAVANTLQERVANGRLLEAAFGPAAGEIFRRVESVHIVACGTSYHAGVVARYFIEQICRIPCHVEIASEFRYRNPVVAPQRAVRHHLAVGRDRRYAGRAAAGEADRLPRDAGDLQRAGEFAGARIRAGDADARRSRDRRCLDQGLHDPAHGARHAGDRAGAPPRLGRRARARPGAAAGRAARAAGEDAGARSGHSSPGAALCRKAPRAVPRPRRAARGRDGGRAEAQGDLLHPRRGLRGGRTQARAAGAGRCRHAGDHGGAEQRPAGEAEVEPDGSARPRRRAVRVRRPGVGLRIQRRRARDPDAAARRAISRRRSSTRSRCSCSPITSRSCAAPMSTSRATSPRA